MPSCFLDDQLVRQCFDIDSPERYEEYLTEVKAKAIGHDLVQAADPEDERTKALVAMAAHCRKATEEWEAGRPILSHATHNVTRLKSSHPNGWRIAAGALYLVSHGDVEYVRGLLLSTDPFTPPLASEDGLYFLVKFIGYSGNNRFAPILDDVLRQGYHFAGPARVIDAIKNLRCGVDELHVGNATRDLKEDGTPRLGSIRPCEGVDGIGIVLQEDERFTGYFLSCCPTCRFFPCRINRYFTGSIEDCKLWNSVDPETLGGEIIDYTDWGKHTTGTTIDPDITAQERIWVEVQTLMLAGPSREAIPGLCKAVVLGRRSDVRTTASVTALAWVYLSDCLYKYEETRLAFIALREAWKLKNNIPVSSGAEALKVKTFDNRAEAILGQDASTRDLSEVRFEAVRRRERGKWVDALDCYALVNICEAGERSGSWFEMGLCHRELGEYSLAELFMRWAAIQPNIEISRRQRYLDEANKIQEALGDKCDVGLLPGRRAAIKVVISGDESTSLTALLSNIVTIKGVIRDDAAQSESRVGLRGGGLSDFIPLNVSGFAIPAFFKAIEVFILTRKIEIKIQLPDKNAKLKLSGITKADLDAQIKKLLLYLKK